MASDLKDFLEALDKLQLATEDYLKDYFADVGWTKEILAKREKLRAAKNALIVMYNEAKTLPKPYPLPWPPTWKPGEIRVIPETAEPFPQQHRTYCGGGTTQ